LKYNVEPGQSHIKMCVLVPYSDLLS